MNLLRKLIVVQSGLKFFAISIPISLMLVSACLEQKKPDSTNPLAETISCVPDSNPETVSCTKETPHSILATKTRTCNTAGNGYIYGTCTIEQCESGYEIENNSCNVVACTAGESYGTVACTSGIPYSSLAVKTKKCNAAGNGYEYGPCTIQQCKVGYYILENSCAAQKCSPQQNFGLVTCIDEIPHSTAATKPKTCNSNGSGYDYGLCSVTQCEQNYRVVANASCVPLDCAPNQSYGTVDCTGEAPFSATAQKTKTCNSIGDGYIYGACQVTACQPGHLFGNNSCSLCMPNEDGGTVSCIGEIHGSSVATKTRTCNWAGNGYNYGPCNLVSCSSSYDMTGTACTPKPLGDFSIEYMAVRTDNGVSPSYVHSCNFYGRWTNSENASGYTYTVLRPGYPGRFTANECSDPTGRVAVCLHFAACLNGIYRLDVTARGVDGITKTKSFEYALGVLGSFSINSKTTIVLNDGIPDTFSWTSSSGASDYWFGIGSTTNCSVTYYDTTTSSTTVTLPVISLPLRTVYVCVTARSGSQTKNASNNGMPVVVSNQ